MGIKGIIDGWKFWVSQGDNFNLVDDPWIPVTDKNGQYKKISIMEFAVNGKKYNDIVAPTMKKIVVFDFLKTIMQDALDGPKNSSDAVLKEAYKNAPTAMVEYLNKYRNKFNLYGKNAFLQPNNVEANKPNKSISIMDCSLATGEKNSIHFDHGAIDIDARDFSDDKRALNLLEFCVIPPHTKVSTYIWGKDSFKYGDSGSTPASPAWNNRGIYVYIQKENLFETIFSNLLTKEDIRREMSWGVPPWRKFPTSIHDTAAIDNLTKTYLGSSIVIYRLVKFQKDSNKISFTVPLWNYENYFHRACPYHFVEKGKNAGWKHCSSSSRLQLWRDIPAILGVNDKAENMKVPVAVARYLCRNKDFDIWVGSIESDSMCSIVKDECESIYHIPKDATNVETSEFINGIRKAKKICSALNKSIASCKKFKEDSRVSPKKAENKFWMSVDFNRDILYDSISNMDHHGRWERFMEDTAKRVYMDTMKRSCIPYEKQVDKYNYLLKLLAKI